jgi:hypothetical protein
LAIVFKQLFASIHQILINLPLKRTVIAGGRNGIYIPTY